MADIFDEPRCGEEDDAATVPTPAAATAARAKRASSELRARVTGGN
jgi:hypothetical protein